MSSSEQPGAPIAAAEQVAAPPKKLRGDSDQLRIWRETSRDLSGSKKVVKKMTGDVENPEYRKIKDEYTKRVMEARKAKEQEQEVPEHQ